MVIGSVSNLDSAFVSWGGGGGGGESKKDVILCFLLWSIRSWRFQR